VSSSVIRRRGVIVLAATCVALLPLRPLSPQRPDARRIAAFDRALDSLRSRLRIPGLSAAIAYDDVVIWSRGYGFADVEHQVAATAHTPYNVASLSKPIGTVLLLRLVEQGKVNLDDPMSKYSTDYHGDSIHVRHVLTHTSGGVPGEHFEYNGDVFASLFDVIVKASGRRYRELVANDIMRPLGMTDSSPGNDIADNQPAMVQLLGADADARYVEAMRNLAKPYKYDSSRRAVPSRETVFGLSPANGIVSSVLDFAKFDSALDRGRLLEPATQKMMWTPARTAAGERLPYALGWFVQDYAGLHLIWHNGYLPDRYSALYLKIPDRKLTLLLLANSDALSSPFKLAKGDLSPSAFACAFLVDVVVVEDTCRSRSEAAIRGWATRERGLTTIVRPLLGTESDSRIDLRRAPSRNQRRGNTKPDQQRRGAAEREGVERTDVEQQRDEQPASEYGSHETDHRTQPNHPRCLADDELVDVAWRRTERDPHTDIPRLLPNGDRHDSIKSDRR